MTRFISALVATTILLGSVIPVFAGPLHDAAAAGNVEQIQELIAVPTAQTDIRSGPGFGGQVRCVRGEYVPNIALSFERPLEWWVHT